jgi:hypothetical protein|tara:strand:+ start:10647 stop:11048 length:402 start_codon:yes stop_codon:yes gene_type:complete
MAESFKILGQVYLQDASGGSAPVWKVLYVVPERSDAKYGSASAQAVISSIVICNEETSDTKYNIAVVPNGEDVNSSPNFHHIIFNEKVVASESTHVISLGLGLQSGDAIYVKQSKANDGKKFSVNAFGIEMVS